MELSIREIKEGKEILAFLPLLHQLQPGLSAAQMQRCLDDMLPAGYRFFAVYDGIEIAGCTGLWKNSKFYCGRFLEIDNFVVDVRYRSKGVGKFITDFLSRLAKEENKSAHAFYEREGFVKRGYHFILDI